MKTQQNVLQLTTLERAAILDHVPLPPGVVARLRFAVHAGANVEVRLSEEELDAVARSMLHVLARTEDMALAEVLAGILSRVKPVLAEDIPEEYDRSDFPPEIPDEICQEIHTLLRSGAYSDLDEALEAVKHLFEGHNDEPLEVLSGLTPDQGHQLLSGGWSEPGSAIQIRGDVAPEEVAESMYCRNATTMLRLLEEGGGAGLTTKKNLNRKWVQEILQAFYAPRHDFLLEAKEFATISEQRCPPVHYVRILLELARLIRVCKGKLLVTKLGRECLDPARAGALQAHLFTAMVTKFNIAYFDGAPGYSGVQETYPFILYVLSQVAREPVPESVARAAVFLPEVAAGFAVYERFSHENLVFHTRVLQPLRDFGLVRWTPEERDVMDDTELQLQITPLFDRMIHFDFSRAAAPKTTGMRKV